MSDQNTGKTDWRERARSIQSMPPEGRSFVDGRYVGAAGGRTFDSISPIDGRILGQVAACDGVDVDKAVEAGRRAFEDGRWSGLAPMRRKEILLRFAQLMLDNHHELALLETLDMGKPISDSLAVDIPATACCFRWYAEAIDKLYGEVAPTAPGTIATITREPIGVVAAVVPWNFPLIMAAWKLAPALASGNSVILKPAEQSSFTAIRIGALALEAGLPEGVLNVIPGQGVAAGRALGLHPDIDGVFFTGSTKVGKLFLQYAGQSNLKTVGLECGGKSAHIILDDCETLDGAADAVADGIFFNQGEMCTAGSRLIVHRDVQARVMERLMERRGRYDPGDPLLETTRMGALVDENHMNHVLRYIGMGEAEGARIAGGGKRARAESGGFFVEPTVFENVDPRMCIAREEIFGPVLSVITVSSADEAVHVANDSVYGLAAAVWSDRVSTLHNVARRLRAGMVYMNCYDADDITVPFGGYKQSGIGRDKSLHAFDKYTELKTSWLNVGA